MSAAVRGPVCGHRLWRPQDTIPAAFSGRGRPGVAPAASALGTTFLLPLPVRPVRALMGCRTLTAVAPLFVTCPLCPLVGGWGVFTPRLRPWPGARRLPVLLGYFHVSCWQGPGCESLRSRCQEEASAHWGGRPGRREEGSGLLLLALRPGARRPHRRHPRLSRGSGARRFGSRPRGPGGPERVGGRDQGPRGAHQPLWPKPPLRALLAAHLTCAGRLEGRFPSLLPAPRSRGASAASAAQRLAARANSLRNLFMQNAGFIAHRDRNPVCTLALLVCRAAPRVCA